MKATFICWNVHNAFYFWLLEATCINMREIWSKSNDIKDTKFSASYNDNGASHTTLTVSVIVLKMTKKVKTEAQ